MQLGQQRAGKRDEPLRTSEGGRLREGVAYRGSFTVHQSVLPLSLLLAGVPLPL